MSHSLPGRQRAPRARTRRFYSDFAEALERRTLLAAGPTLLLKDIKPGTASSDASSFIAFKGLMYFRADDGVHGVEWWRTDGTPAGTSMLADINPGPGHSMLRAPQAGTIPTGVSTAAVVGDTLFFTAYQPSTGAELWKTDGTAAGTVMVKDVRPGQGSTPRPPQRFLPVGDALYFVADDGTNGTQVWKSDGTAAGTQRVSDVPRGPTNQVMPLAALGGRLVFAAFAPDATGDGGLEPWITDGTPAGTSLLRNIHPTGASYPGGVLPPDPQVAVVGNVLYFPAADLAHGRELWKTDGTPGGTVLVADLNVPGTASSFPGNLTNVNGHLYFTGDADSADIFAYRVDPSSGAVVRIPGPVGFQSGVGGGSAVGGKFFVAGWWQNQGALFTHDPATPDAGLTLVKRLGEATSWPNEAGPIVDDNGTALFMGPGPGGTVRLWRSDGTAEGTVEQANFLGQGIPDANEYHRWRLTEGAGGVYYFVGRHPETGTEVYRTGGGPASLVKDVNTFTAPSLPSDVMRLGGVTLFRADDGVHGNEWFRTDGTAAGTSILLDINPGEAASLASPFPPPAAVPLAAVVGGTMYFGAVAPAGGPELWKTDGTAAGTVPVKEIRPGAARAAPTHFIAVGNLVYFVADDGTHGAELWKSDGTDAGTVRVADVAPGAASSQSVPLGALGERLVFAAAASGSLAEREPWVTDGTAAGTTLLKDIHPSGGSQPGVLLGTLTVPAEAVVSGGELYFPATDAARGRELWKTDGTPAGTVLVADVNPGAASAVPMDLTDVNGTLYFTGRTDDVFGGAVFRTLPAGGVESVGALGSAGLASGHTTGGVGGVFYIVATAQWGPTGLFRHDPSRPAGGLQLVKELRGRPLQAGEIHDAGGAAMFLAHGSAANTSALWRSDGTAAGTVELATYAEAPLGPTGRVERWTVRPGGDGAVYFAAAEPQTGVELYRSDGTVVGTGLITDLNRDTVAAIDGGTIAYVNGPAGGRTLFVANDGVSGRELWATDGTPGGTFLLKDVDPGAGSGMRALHTPFSPDINGLVYFPGYAPDGNAHLWVTDGTTAGTRPVGVPWGPVVLFRGRAHLTGGADVSVTDGTAAGTTPVVDLDPELLGREAVVVGDTMYLFTVRYVDGSIAATELWKTDGTQAGTSLVRVLSAERDVVGDGPPAAALGDALYFVTQTGLGRPVLWRADAGGASVVRELPHFQGTLTQVAAAGGKVFFQAGVEGSIDPSRTTVWVADAAGARPVTDVAPALAEMTNITGLAAAGDVAFFFAQPPGRTALELWRTDGTAAGTLRLKEATASPRPLGAVDGVYYFGATDAATGTELWRSDGTVAGTVLVQDIRPGTLGSDPWNLAKAGGRIYFSADDGTHGRELWSMPAAQAVVGRSVFYNNSGFDGRNPAATAADLGAVAPDKAALLPGGAGSFANVTSYDKGINGVLIDFAGAPAVLTAADFDFRVGRSGDPGAWAAAPAPASVVMLPGPAGTPFSRYAITWADGAIVNTWLQVTVKANERTGVATPDVFRFGNLVGETGDGPTGGGLLPVTASDMWVTRQRDILRQPLASTLDINRDRVLNVADATAVRRNLFRSLPLIGFPVPATAGPAASPRPAPAARGVFSQVGLSATDPLADDAALLA